MQIQGIREEVETEIVRCAIKNDIKKLIVFGSRARGDFRRTSDIDLAVSGGNISEFALDIEEDVPTLLKFDVINLDGSVQKELIDSIRKEGIVVYEKI